MKRLRGARKYLWRIHRNARSLRLELTPEDAYVFWHSHVGLVGRRRYVRPRPAFRREFRHALVAAFERVLAQAAQCERPFQTWLQLEDDFDQDAVFFHMPPADSSAPFPMKLEAAQWDLPLPGDLQGLLAPERVRVGAVSWDGTRVLYVVPRGVGVPLW